MSRGVDLNETEVGSQRNVIVDLLTNDVTDKLTLAADLWAVEQDIVNTIDHPIIGVVGNAATLAMGTNPIVKLWKDFPEVALKICGGIVAGIVLLKLIF